MVLGRGGGGGGRRGRGGGGGLKKKAGRAFVPFNLKLCLPGNKQNMLHRPGTLKLQRISKLNYGFKSVRQFFWMD